MFLLFFLVFKREAKEPVLLFLLTVIIGPPTRVHCLSYTTSPIPLPGTYYPVHLSHTVVRRTVSRNRESHANPRSLRLDSY